MNHLPRIGAGEWQLARHAHIVVFDGSGDQDLLTIYDCGVAQAPPVAQIRGHLVRITASHDLKQTHTGYQVTLTEPAILIDQGQDHYVIKEA